MHGVPAWINRRNPTHLIQRQTKDSLGGGIARNDSTLCVLKDDAQRQRVKQRATVRIAMRISVHGEDFRACYWILRVLLPQRLHPPVRCVTLFASTSQLQERHTTSRSRLPEWLANLGKSECLLQPRTATHWRRFAGRWASLDGRVFTLASPVHRDFQSATGFQKHEPSQPTRRRRPTLR